MSPLKVIYVSSQQLGQSHVPSRGERQRCQEMLAELAIGKPWLPLFIVLERERVDQYRTAASKLHVVGGRVFQNHIVPERHSLYG